MSEPALTVAPTLSTDSSDLFSPAAALPPPQISHLHLPDHSFAEIYEISSTATQILSHSSKPLRIALQFPDSLLADSSRVYSLLSAALTPEHKLFILADTSFAACCVDEIAAQHADADLIVHYGRACLSPTQRMPVIYVFTQQPLDLDAAVKSFEETYTDKEAPIVLTSDVTFSSHLPSLLTHLKSAGYTSLFATEIIHDPSAPIPNRTSPQNTDLKSHHLFHLAEPLPALQMLLASRFESVNYYDPTNNSVSNISTTASRLLRRRYALLSHARSASIIGILVNTLNVRHYLPLVSLLTRQIAAAGRKSYTVVVGKVNVEKVANFAEVEVWVGVGCWEQGVVGGVEGRGFYRPVVTPWELQVALGGREWGEEGGWVADFGVLLKREEEKEKAEAEKPTEDDAAKEGEDGSEGEEEEDDDSEEESAPPEYDFRLGRYVTASLPVGKPKPKSKKKASSSTPAEKSENKSSSAITTSSRQRELQRTGGVFSPGAMYNAEKRTWTGLGSDWTEEDAEKGRDSGEGALVEEGRKGVARGYVVGDEGRVH